MPTFRRRAAIRDALLSLNPRRRDYMGLRRVMMNFILEEIAKRHYRAFLKKKRKGYDEFGRRWARLKPYTIAKKGHDKIGYETGHMEASFRPGYTTRDGHYIPGHPDQIAEATAYSATFGTRAVQVRRGRRRPKAKFFHEGVISRRHKQAARPFWRGREIDRWVADGIRNAMPHVARIIRSRAR